MASDIYGAGVVAMAQGDIEWKSGGSTLKAKLCLSSLSYDDTHEDRADIDSHDADGSADITLTLSDPDSASANKILLKAQQSLTFAGVDTGQTVGSVIVYRDTGTPANDTLLCFLDIDNTATNGGDVIVTVPNSVYLEMLYS